MSDLPYEGEFHVPDYTTGSHLAYDDDVAPEDTSHLHAAGPSKFPRGGGYSPSVDLTSQRVLPMSLQTIPEDDSLSYGRNSVQLDTHNGNRIIVKEPTEEDLKNVTQLRRMSNPKGASHFEDSQTSQTEAYFEFAARVFDNVGTVLTTLGGLWDKGMTQTGLSAAGAISKIVATYPEFYKAAYKHDDDGKTVFDSRGWPVVEPDYSKLLKVALDTASAGVNVWGMFQSESEANRIAAGLTAAAALAEKFPEMNAKLRRIPRKSKAPFDVESQVRADAARSASHPPRPGPGPKERTTSYSSGFQSHSQGSRSSRGRGTGPG